MSIHNTINLHFLMITDPVSQNIDLCKTKGVFKHLLTTAYNTKMQKVTQKHFYSLTI